MLANQVYLCTISRMANREQLQKLGEVKEWLDGGAINAFGRQFGGKDSHLKRLKVPLDGVILGAGEVFRAAKANPNPAIPADVLEKIDRGELADSRYFAMAVAPEIKRAAKPEQALLLSAVGRKSGEEEGVMQAATDAGHPIRVAVDLAITREESHRRLAITPDRGRDDDTPEGLDTRLDFFDEFTVPVLGTYEERGLLVVVDAMPEEEVVFNTLVHTLHDRATGKG